MLRVTFHQFRCWDDLVIEAPIGGITLIKGSSGVGKTTILQGITWCLYGNIRLVTPNHSEKARTRILIELPYNLSGIHSILTINRQKNPNRLLVSHNGQVYEDKVAQAIIDDLFGTYDIWLASCYIGQGCRNSFLTAPNTGKMELLNSIAFHEEDPTSFIERIDINITEIDTEYKSKLALFTNNLNSFQNLLTNTDITKALTPEQIINITSQINANNQERLRLTGLKSQRTIDIGIMENMQRQLNQVNNTTVIIPDPGAVLVSMNTKYEGGPLNISENVDANLQRALDIIPILQRRVDLDSEVKRFDSLLLPFVNISKGVTYTVADYQEAVSKETSYRDSQRLAQSLGVLYSETAINETIRKHRDILSAQERLKLEQERDDLQTRIGMMEMEHLQQTTPLVFPDVTPQVIPAPNYSKYNTEALSLELTELSKSQGAIQTHIQHLQKGHDVLQCPHCKGPVRYLAGISTTANTGLKQAQLVPASSLPTTQDEILAAQQQHTVINAEIARVNKSIQALSAEEASVRAGYERSTAMEQRRIDTLKERVRQLELEKQRRDIANQNRAQHIKSERDKLQFLNEAVTLIPEVKLGNRRVLSTKEIDQTHALIGRLAGITILSPPQISSQQIQSYINYQDLLQKNVLATAAHNQHLETIPIMFRNEPIRSVQTYIDELRNYWNRIKETAAERVRLNHLKTSLETQIQSIIDKLPPDPTPDIDKMTAEISALQESINLSARAHQAIQYHTQITKEREDVVSLNAALSDLQVLRQHAVETECRILQQMVDSINASIQGVCNTLFDKDINITLNLFKTLKTTKNVKPVANFSISYQGGVFDNINQMSGGEGDRASLALTLALNRLSSCPILMLDESLASLDLNMKEAAIRTIRENTNNTVLIILHDGIEGIFDNILNMDEIRETRPLA
ncbi:Chromosome segregation ATPase [uncultured virus]|nr:Chromosome segregation ATPase [uncultured virus]